MDKSPVILISPIDKYLKKGQFRIWLESLFGKLIAKMTKNG